MKSKVTTLICAVSISTLAVSQDVIIFKNGNEKKVKVLEVSPTEVKYKNFDYLEGPLYTDQKSTIFLIKYENGFKDVFGGESKPTVTTSQEPATSEKEISQYSYSVTDDFQNIDFIVTAKGDTIRCKIELVTNTTLTYHIFRRGIDTKSEMPMKHVSRYYKNRELNIAKVLPVETEQVSSVVPQEKEQTKKDEVQVDEDEFLPEARRYGGPRVGVTLVGPGAYRDLLYAEGKRNIYSQFGWQFEKRLFTTKTGISGIVEFVPMIGGIDMGKFIPSATALIGIRTHKGIEFGAGPNAAIYGVKDSKGYYKTSASFGIVIAAGMSFKSDKVYFPVNLVFIPSVGKTANVPQADGSTKTVKYQTGMKLSLLVGFNYRKG